MRAYVVFSSSEPVLVVTRHPISSPEVVTGFRRIGCLKFFAREVPVDLVRTLYGHQYEVVERALDENSTLRVLDYNGRRIFKYVPLSDLGPAYRCDLASPTDAPALEAGSAPGVGTPAPATQILFG
jgi:hypothetical protein